MSDESGRYEVYVRPFTGAGGRWQLSTAGGFEPRWRRDGRELFYLAEDRKIVAVPVQPGATFRAGAAVALFAAPVRGSLQGWDNANYYDVSADGQRFLVNVPVEETDSAQLAAILNWKSLLRR